MLAGGHIHQGTGEALVPVPMEQLGHGQHACANLRGSDKETNICDNIVILFVIICIIFSLF